MVVALATENAELRAALAEAQELLIETAVDAGEMHARIEVLQAEVTTLRTERDAIAFSGQRRPLARRG
ncbi:hypothetical protein MKK60_13480 [Methylobacterium sp. J-092]|nr:hypothetical protein [Methylobacterium sp. J-092]